MHDVEIEGYFTNHSARCTGGTHLFQAGVDRKLVKKATGHHSDAVDKYQVTSHEQRKAMSAILQNNPGQHIEQKKIPNVEEKDEKCTKSETKVTVNSLDNNKSVELNAKNVGDFISNIIDKSRGQGKNYYKNPNRMLS